MFNIGLILEQFNQSRSVKIHLNCTATGQKYLCFSFKKEWFHLEELKQLLFFLKQINTSIYNKMPLLIDLKDTLFFDKLSFMLIECLCYHLLTINPNRLIAVRYSPRYDIITNGLRYSPLQFLNSFSHSQIQNKDFKKKFEIDLSNGHFRRLIKRTSQQKDTLIASSLMQDVKHFLEINNVEPSYISNVSEVVSELVGNTIEHTDSDCLIDIDITKEQYYKVEKKQQVEQTDPSKLFYGLNVAIVDFSKDVLGTRLQSKMSVLRFEENIGARYKYLLQALNQHSSLFSKEYNERDFFLIASFQHRISSRVDSVLGGTGLTALLRSLETKSDAYRCYVLSGRSILMFIHHYLSYNSEGWIGFNDTNDFLNCAPSKGCLKKTPFYFPGTAYNLNFVVEIIEKEGKTDEN